MIFYYDILKEKHCVDIFMILKLKHLLSIQNDCQALFVIYNQ